MSFHVTCCLPKTSILISVVFSGNTIHVIFCLPKTSIPFSAVFPVHVHSRYFLPPEDQHSFQCCFPSSFRFTLLSVSQRPAFPSLFCSQFMSVHVTFSLPKTSIPFRVVFPVHVHSRYFISPKHQHSLQCCVPSSWPFTLIAISKTPAFPSGFCS